MSKSFVYVVDGRVQEDHFNTVIKPIIDHYGVSVDLAKYPFQPVTGKTYVLTGDKGLDYLAAIKLIQKRQSLTSAGGRVYGQAGAKFLITPDLADLEENIQKAADIKWGIVLACRYVTTGRSTPELGNYRWVDDFRDCLAYIAKNYQGKSLYVSLDLETIGLDPYYKGDDYNAEIVSVSITYREGESDVPHTLNGISRFAKEQLQEIISDPKIKLTGANLKYDALWLYVHYGIEIKNQTFDTNLVGSLLNENQGNSLSLHAKLYTALGGYDDCVSPDTLICTDDLRWVPIKNIKPGDGLLGFDEKHPNISAGRRRLQRTKAISKKKIIKPGVEVEFTNGIKIKCSKDHGFLAHKYKGNGPYHWINAAELRVGVRVMAAIDKEAHSKTWKAGYLSGLYDGEGYLSYVGGGLVSGLSQQPGLVWNRYFQYMKEIGLGGFYARQKNTDGVFTSKHGGAETLRMLQILRPIRLLDKYGYVGKALPSSTKKVYVKLVKDIGDIEVISLQTGTCTFVAEGICSHNSFNWTYNKNRMDRVPKPELLNYAGGDTDACYRVTKRMRRTLAMDKKMSRFYTRIVMPANRVFQKIERRGVVVDQERYISLEAEVKKELRATGTKLLGMIPRGVRNRYPTDTSLTNPGLIRDFLFGKHGMGLDPIMLTGKKKDPACSGEHYDELILAHPDNHDLKVFTEGLKEWVNTQDTLSTYIHGFKKFIRSDGKFHPTYNLYKGYDGGTVTGRLSAVDPGWQLLPKHTRWAKAIRSVFVPPPGMAILKIDFSQGELRIVADVANEQVMLQAFRDGKDLHTLTVCEVSGISPTEYDALSDFDKGVRRRAGKACNFGLLYGMFPKGFQRYARTSYGVLMSLDNATKYRNGFFVLYPGLPGWHDEKKMLARRDKQIVSRLGRIRHLPLINSKIFRVKNQQERRAINSDIQSDLSDMMLLSLVEIDKQYQDLWAFGVTHDEAQFYVPVDDVQELGGKIKEIMENLPLHEFDWNPKVKFVADAEASSINLGKCEAI